MVSKHDTSLFWLNVLTRKGIFYIYTCKWIRSLPCCCLLTICNLPGFFRDVCLRLDEWGAIKHWGKIETLQSKYIRKLPTYCTGKRQVCVCVCVWVCGVCLYTFCVSECSEKHQNAFLTIFLIPLDKSHPGEATLLVTKVPPMGSGKDLFSHGFVQFLLSRCQSVHV